jgi:hypothetical protein
MDLRRLRVGEWGAAISGGALLVSLFLPWYSPSAPAEFPLGPANRHLAIPPGREEASSMSGWDSLSVLDIVLALIAVTAIALLAVTATQRVPAVTIAFDAVVALLGIYASLLVVLRALNPPDGADGREWGLWLGLAGALGIAIAGTIAMRDERQSPPGKHTDSTGRPAPPPPELEPIPAPGPEGAR